MKPAALWKRIRITAFLGWRTLIGWPRYFLDHPRFAPGFLARRLRAFVRQDLDRPIRTPDGFDLVSLNPFMGYWSLFVCRELHHPRWITPLQTARAPLVLDIGANWGMFSHWILCLNPAARVIAFEPLPDMIRHLSDWAPRRGGDLRILAKAVSSQSGSAPFYARTADDGEASLNERDKKEADCFRVDTIALDEMPELRGENEVFLLKIDVEGHECEVLRGAANTLRKTRFLLIEANSRPALVAVKRQLGPEWVCRRVGCVDYFFSREKQGRSE
jgi:FkbM family methyltransferase